MADYAAPDQDWPPTAIIGLTALLVSSLLAPVGWVVQHFWGSKGKHFPHLGNHRFPSASPPWDGMIHADEGVDSGHTQRNNDEEHQLETGQIGEMRETPED
jgi:hypothetical protein